MFWLLITLFVSRDYDSATGANPVLDCDFVWLGNLLKRNVTAIGTIATLVGIGFSNYGVILVEHRTASKDQ